MLLESLDSSLDQVWIVFFAKSPVVDILVHSTGEEAIAISDVASSLLSWYNFFGKGFCHPVRPQFCLSGVGEIRREF